MKKINLATAIAWVTLLLSPRVWADSPLPASLPEFKDQAQMAQWTSAQTPQAAEAGHDTATFYTGKPYVADAGGYVYKYRTYNPEMSRWTSADPSGYPDGVNNVRYAPLPTSQVDLTGLSVNWITEEDNTSDPNPTIEAKGTITFSWSISDNGSVISGGHQTTDYNGAMQNPGTVGYYTGAPANNPNAGVGSFGTSFTLNLASYSQNSWSLNGWSVSATFLQNVGGVNYNSSNQWLNPIGASTSSSTIAGLSTLLYNALLKDGAGYNGDLFYE